MSHKIEWPTQFSVYFPPEMHKFFLSTLDTRIKDDIDTKPFLIICNDDKSLISGVLYSQSSRYRVEKLPKHLNLAMNVRLHLSRIFKSMTQEIDCNIIRLMCIANLDVKTHVPTYLLVTLNVSRFITKGYKNR